jgi:hypothetical protein
VTKLVPGSQDYGTEDFKSLSVVNWGFLLITSFLLVSSTIRTSWHGGNTAMK